MKNDSKWLLIYFLVLRRSFLAAWRWGALRCIHGELPITDVSSEHSGQRCCSLWWLFYCDDIKIKTSHRWREENEEDETCSASHY